MSWKPNAEQGSPTNVPNEEDMWYEGDRVYVPRITTDESVELIIKQFIEHPKHPDDPDVELISRRWQPVKGSALKKELTHIQIRTARFSELERPPLRRTKGGAVRRAARGMAEIQCQCGCGNPTSGGMFRQGHDAKLKSILRKVMDGRMEPTDRWPSPDAAKQELHDRNWL